MNLDSRGAIYDASSLLYSTQASVTDLRKGIRGSTGTHFAGNAASAYGALWTTYNSDEDAGDRDALGLNSGTASFAVSSNDSAVADRVRAAIGVAAASPQGGSSFIDSDPLAATDLEGVLTSQVTFSRLVHSTGDLASSSTSNPASQVQQGHRRQPHSDGPTTDTIRAAAATRAAQRARQSQTELHQALQHHHATAATAATASASASATASAWPRPRSSFAIEGASAHTAAAAPTSPASATGVSIAMSPPAGASVRSMSGSRSISGSGSAFGSRTASYGATD